ncbi:MAG: hypothetical protein M3082_09930, partial [Candidatus Dormibacteraeota bacterium]|nr:hypothetical protein [Candidatus Dormibacteraeota bacterium]
MSLWSSRRFGDWLTNAVLVLFTAVVLFPFYWLLVSSLKSSDQLFQVPPLWVPAPPTLDNFERLIQGA